jgi:hypothetical protein
MFNQNLFIMKNDLFSDKNVKLVVTAKTIKGTSFVGLRDYSNAQGEVSNYTINAGISYFNVLTSDYQKLIDIQNDIVLTLKKQYPIAVVEKAYYEVLTSLEKRLSDEETKEQLRAEGDKTIAQSDAQINAYINLAKGVKLHKDTMQLHVFGLVVRKTILQPTEYKPTKSRELTIVKNKIKKLCEFKQDKYRTFIFNKGDIKMQGIEI